MENRVSQKSDKTPVSTLLGETVIETEIDTLKAISEKLEGDKLATGTKKNYGKKNYLLVAYFVMCNHWNFLNTEKRMKLSCFWGMVRTLRFIATSK